LTCLSPFLGYIILSKDNLTITNMTIEYKTTVWQRFEIEDEHEESLLRFLKENPKTSGLDIYNYYCDEIGGDPYCETIDETSQEISVDENNGYSTLGILLGEQVLFQNGK